MKTNTPTTAVATTADVKLHGSNMTFSMDKVKQSITPLKEEHQAAIIWLFQVAKQANWSLKTLAEEVGYSTTSWHKLFSGKFEGNIINIYNKIVSFRRLYEERQAAIAPDFIVTSLTKRIWEACDFACISQSVVFLWGENQIGKTAALEEYQRTHNHGQTIYVRMPASSGVQMVARQIAKACGISPNSSFEKLRERIMSGIDHKNNLVFDEMHLAFTTYQQNSCLKVLEFIREIHDRTKCGMILCGTNVWRDEVNEGKHKKMLDQLRNRGVAHIQLEQRPKKADQRKFWEFYGLEDPTGAVATIVKDIIAENGLGKFVKYLQTAARMASKRNETVSWDHFYQTHNTINSLSKTN